MRDPVLTMSSRAWIGLGSNMGDRRQTLEGAIRALSQVPGVVVQQVSSFLETEPVGGPAGQGMYLNAAAALETTLDPFEPLGVLHQIEAWFGRVRHDPVGRVRWISTCCSLKIRLSPHPN